MSIIKVRNLTAGPEQTRPASQDDSGHDPHPVSRRMLGTGAAVHKPSLQVAKVSAFAEIDPCNSIAHLYSIADSWFP